MKLHFDADAVRQLLAHAVGAPAHRPTFEQLFDGACRKDGHTIDPLTVSDLTRPTGADADVGKVPAGLWLVGDQGIYLMSNGQPPLLRDGTGSSHVLAYAREADPVRNQNTWWTTKRFAFGADDGVVFLEAVFVIAMLAASRGSLAAIDLTPRQVAVTGPANPAG